MKKILVLFLFLSSLACQAQITINIRYNAPNGGALKYMKEMEATGLADSIRAIKGCMRYDYFIPQDDPESVLLIDQWEDLAALNRYHSSPVMKQAEALRAKYKLERNAQMFTPMRPGGPRPGAAPGQVAPSTVKPDNTMIVRISEIEVYPEYLKEYLEFASKIGLESDRVEPGVICIYPMQQIKNPCQIRILEIYASKEAYEHHITTDHFKTYKQGTLHMVKSLDLVDMIQMAPEALPIVFRKVQQ